MTETTDVGFDFGNAWAKLCIDGLFAKIPSRYAWGVPPGAISAKTGMELKPVAFKLIFEDKPLWFGQDTLGTGAIQKLGMGKYHSDHISILFRAALYQWGEAHKVDLATLGKLNVVCSMPPGLYQGGGSNKVALAAFRKAFNRGQSHAKIKSAKATIQIVTQFGALIQEAVAWGQAMPRLGEMVLTVDLGGFTNDYAIFNGGVEPLKALTDDSGLIHAFSAMGKNTDPALAELKILRNKKAGLPHQVITYYNEVERRIQLITTRVGDIDRLYIIGGGAALMTPNIESSFTPLASKVVIKNEYANAEANWRHAGGLS